MLEEDYHPRFGTTVPYAIGRRWVHRLVDGAISITVFECLQMTGLRRGTVCDLTRYNQNLRD